MDFPTEIWEIILDHVSFYDCLSFRKASRRINDCMHNFQPHRFVNLETAEELSQFSVKPFIKKYQCKLMSRAKKVDGCFIRVGDKVLLIQLLYIPMSWVDDPMQYFQISIDAQVSQSMEQTRALEYIYTQGIDTFTVSLLPEYYSQYDGFMTDQLYSSSDPMRAIKDALEKGYVFKRMVDGTLGYSSSEETLFAPDEAYFETPHWQILKQSSRGILVVGQDCAKAIPIDKPYTISRFLRMVARRWSVYPLE